MATSNAKTVAEYLDSLPPEKRDVIQNVREVILKNIPNGVVEAMNWGMITYEIPLSIFPNTYNDQPLMFAALAAQKNHYSIYVTNLYMIDENMEKLNAAYEKFSIKPNIGKSCIRFTKIENIPLDTIAEIIASTTVDEYMEKYKESRTWLKNG
ncbi:MAG: DUF1801 domain-containing protein [Clostridiales bacterium]|nr:DUF1801 domain-containing protein [Clostridiales bacterium]